MVVVSSVVVVSLPVVSAPVVSVEEASSENVFAPEVETEASVVVVEGAGVTSVVATETSVVVTESIVVSPLVGRVVSVAVGSIASDVSVVRRHGPACTPLTARMANTALKKEDEIMTDPNK
jgi:hypothetical protein